MMPKRSIIIAGRKTSFSLEDEFYTELRGIAADRRMHLKDLVAEIAAAPGRPKNLSSALRLYVLRQALKPAALAPQACGAAAVAALKELKLYERASAGCIAAVATAIANNMPPAAKAKAA